LGGRLVKVNGNTIAQDFTVTAINASAIQVDEAFYVSISDNSLQGTDLACTGASVERASIHVSGVHFLSWNNNHLFWNTTNSGTAGQAQVKWSECDFGHGTGNIAKGYDGGTNILVSGNSTSGGHVSYVNNKIIGDGTTPSAQGAYTGSASPGGTSLIANANTFDS
jgi:hypothetical protein